MRRWKAYACLLRAYHAIEKKEFELAIRDCSEAIRLCPKYAEAYNKRAIAHGRKKDYDLAIEDFSKAIRLNSKEPDYYCSRGTCYARKKELDDALADFAVALRLAPEDPETLFLRACAYWENQHWKEAVADLTKVVESSTHAQAANLLAWLLATCPDDALRSGRTAVDLARKACELNNWKDGFNLGTLAAAYAECGDFEEAIGWQKKAIELCQDKGRIGEFQQRLALCEQGKACREEGPTGD